MTARLTTRSLDKYYLPCLLHAVEHSSINVVRIYTGSFHVRADVAKLMMNGLIEPDSSIFACTIVNEPFISTVSISTSISIKSNIPATP